MIIAGARGHALDIFSVLRGNDYQGDIVFFDDVNNYPQAYRVAGGYLLLRSLEALAETGIREYVLGVGAPWARRKLREKMDGMGIELMSVISGNAFIGKDLVVMGPGVNIMQGAVITANVSLGDAVLVHVNASIHHDVVVGNYCEISPGARLLGNCRIGNMVSIGSNAVILPHVTVGDGAVVGAGAVVTRDVGVGETVAGVPARGIKRRTL